MSTLEWILTVSLIVIVVSGVCIWRMVKKPSAQNQQSPNNQPATQPIPPAKGGWIMPTILAGMGLALITLVAILVMSGEINGAVYTLHKNMKDHVTAEVNRGVGQLTTAFTTYHDETTSVLKKHSETIVALTKAQTGLTTTLNEICNTNTKDMNVLVTVLHKDNVIEPPPAKVYGVRRTLLPAEASYMVGVLQLRSDTIRAQNFAAPKFDGDREKFAREIEVASKFAGEQLKNANEVEAKKIGLDKEFVSFVEKLTDSEIRDWTGGHPCRTCAERKLDRCEYSSHLQTMEAKEIQKDPSTAPTSFAPQVPVPQTQVNGWTDPRKLGANPMTDEQIAADDRRQAFEVANLNQNQTPNPSASAPSNLGAGNGDTVVYEYEPYQSQTYDGVTVYVTREEVTRNNGVTLRKLFFGGKPFLSIETNDTNGKTKIARLEGVKTTTIQHKE